MELAVLVLTLLTLGTVGLAVLARRTAGRAEERVSAFESHDLLTGLPKRAALLRAIESQIASAPRGNTRPAVMLIELNRFSAINETYGHEVGDALLRSVSRRFESDVQPNEVLGRHGGPQFALLSPEIRGLDHAQRRAAELLHALDAPLRLQNDNIRVSASVGFILLEQHPGTPEQVLDDAATALRQAVAEGPNRIVPFELALRAHMSPATAERQLREAFEKDQFWLFYMPVVEIETNNIVGVEALLRWADPEHGISAPDRFLSALDDTGLIVPVGMWAIEQACAQAKQWQEQSPERELTLTVNVSPRQLMDSEFADQFSRIVIDSGINAEELCLEIGAGTSVYDSESIWHSIRSAKQLGVQIALDDFGVGHASLDYIRRFHIDVLKIEQSFVHRLKDSREDLAIVQQLIGMSQALGLTTIAEGVDAEDQAQALIGLDCHFAQGYYWTTPQPAEVTTRMIDRGRVLPGANGGSNSVDWSGGHEGQSAQTS